MTKRVFYNPFFITLLAYLILTAILASCAGAAERVDREAVERVAEIETENMEVYWSSNGSGTVWWITASAYGYTAESDHITSEGGPLPEDEMTTFRRILKNQAVNRLVTILQAALDEADKLKEIPVEQFGDKIKWSTQPPSENEPAIFSATSTYQIEYSFGVYRYYEHGDFERYGCIKCHKLKKERWYNKYISWVMNGNN